MMERIAQTNDIDEVKAAQEEIAQDAAAAAYAGAHLELVSFHLHTPLSSRHTGQPE